MCVLSWPVTCFGLRVLHACCPDEWYVCMFLVHCGFGIYMRWRSWCLWLFSAVVCVLLLLVFQCSDSVARVHLKRRKNLIHGSTLDRECWCAGCRDTCPVHVFGTWFKSRATEDPPFASFSASELRVNLRRRLACLNIEAYGEYGLHSFRRGHAMDLVERGGDLAMILAAGDWNSSAFKFYLCQMRLESRTVAQAQGEHSSDSEDDVCNDL